MNQFLIIFLLFQIQFLSAQSFSLELTKGQASGSFLKGDSIHIWSNKTTAMEVFTHWSGSGAQYLINNDEWHTVMIVPQAVVQDEFELIANYETLDNPTIGNLTINQWAEENESGIFFQADKLVHFAYPSNPKAIVFFIHGTNGRSESWFSNFEKLSIVKDFVHRGYAVFALNSNETTIGDQDGDGSVRWENSQFKGDTITNVDFKNVLHTKNYIDKNLNFGSLPVFLVGGSNGANFADYCTAALDYKASAHLTGNGLAALFENHPNLKPIIWVQSINDNNPNTDSTQAISNHETLIDQGITTEWHWLLPSPAYPNRFMRSLNGIGSVISTALFDSLSSQGFIDSQGFLTVNNVANGFPLANFVSDFNLTNPQIKDFEYQLNVINADHGANGDFNKTILRFFDECLLSTSVHDSDFEHLQSFNVLPNPTNQHFKIEHEHGKPFHFTLMDVTGNSILIVTEKARSHELNISSLSPGIYLIGIYLDGSYFVKRILKI